MSNANLGWLFYKDYYTAIEDWNNPKRYEEKIKEKVDEIIEKKITLQKNTPLGNTHFQAATTYPGLILGSGYLHELPSFEGQAILGFDFDYTTGLPIIRGSSIKGALRSAFKHWEYITSISSLKTQEEVKKLETEIFEKKDIFFDATIIKTDSKNKILADDYLAPHSDNPLKNPVPLRFIKIAPNVTFRFDFELHDGLISKKAKSKLFQTILEDLGLGAKTNVGYGKFESFSVFKTKEEIEKEKQEEELRKQQLQKQKEQEEQRKKEEKLKKQQEGINALLECKSLDEGFKLLKEIFGVKPNPTNEQKEIIRKFYKKQKKLSKKDIKTFKKYGIE